MEQVKVRFPCTHNFWFKHFIAGTYVWCDGGTTRQLKPVPSAVIYSNVDTSEMHVWLEVESTRTHHA